MQRATAMHMRTVSYCSHRHCCIAPGIRERGGTAAIGGSRGQRSIAVNSFETAQDTEEQPPELDERTIKELMDLGAPPIINACTMCVCCGGGCDSHRAVGSVCVAGCLLLPVYCLDLNLLNYTVHFGFRDVARACHGIVQTQKQLCPGISRRQTVAKRYPSLPYT